MVVLRGKLVMNEADEIIDIKASIARAIKTTFSEPASVDQIRRLVEHSATRRICWVSFHSTQPTG